MEKRWVHCYLPVDWHPGSDTYYVAALKSNNNNNENRNRAHRLVFVFTCLFQF